MLHWRSETWIRLRDMPTVVSEAKPSRSGQYGTGS
ncbi:hypothetical protein ALP66_05042 [Pseudomonas amygdali pv. photiniae]|uniref:Uncharacterized protein n=1 Tax=Pseudomonas amygdali pv. photiniae TaxID=251724 RepID=A0A658K5J4_PSEA0|nr:hypothetical protein ALP66_05042 [Pseudomonas amygdali pv. photiniae]